MAHTVQDDSIIISTTHITFIKEVLSCTPGYRLDRKNNGFQSLEDENCGFMMIHLENYIILFVTRWPKKLKNSKKLVHNVTYGYPFDNNVVLSEKDAKWNRKWFLF